MNLWVFEFTQKIFLEMRTRITEFSVSLCSKIYNYINNFTDSKLLNSIRLFLICRISLMGEFETKKKSKK